VFRTTLKVMLLNGSPNATWSDSITGNNWNTDVDTIVRQVHTLPYFLSITFFFF